MRAFLVTAIAVGIGMWLATLGGQTGSATDWIGSAIGIADKSASVYGW
jgi:hypothetical protein